jgi:hypothetical protein
MDDQITGAKERSQIGRHDQQICPSYRSSARKTRASETTSMLASSVRGVRWPSLVAVSQAANWPISQVASSPARVEDRSKEADDGAGGLVEQSVKFPVWFDPVADDGTPMVQALTQTQTILTDWLTVTRFLPADHDPLHGWRVDRWRSDDGRRVDQDTDDSGRQCSLVQLSHFVRRKRARSLPR